MYNMKVLTNLEDLVGKEISSTLLIDEDIYIVTADNEIIAFHGYGNDFDNGIDIMTESDIKYEINIHSSLRDMLGEYDMFDVKKWEDKMEKKRKEQEITISELHEKREREEYERLKSKFENK